MEHLAQRKKLFNRFTYLLSAFLIIAFLTISGAYNGIIWGFHLKGLASSPIATGIPILDFLLSPFVIIEIIIIAYILKLMMDEEKLETQHKTAQ